MHQNCQLSQRLTVFNLKTLKIVALQLPGIKVSSGDTLSAVSGFIILKMNHRSSKMNNSDNCNSSSSSLTNEDDNKPATKLYPPTESSTDDLSIHSIVSAVECLQQRKLKPDIERIRIYLEKYWPVAYSRDPHIVQELVDQCLARALLVQVCNQDSISFRTPSKIGRMLRVTNILPYYGEVPKSVLIDVADTLARLERAPSEFGVAHSAGPGISVSQLLDYLHEGLRLLNYNKDFMVEKVLPSAIEAGLIVQLDNGQYSAIDNSCLNDTSSNFPTRETKGIGSSQKLTIKTNEESLVESEVSNMSQLMGRCKRLRQNKNVSTKVKVDKRTCGEANEDYSVEQQLIDNVQMQDVDDKLSDKSEDKLIDKSTEETASFEAKGDAKELASVPQRVSTRRKIKKSLGPDFVETTDDRHLMYYLKEVNHTSKCAICMGAFPKPKPSIHGRRRQGGISENEPADPSMIQCYKCDSKVHMLCLNLVESIGLRYQWYCGSCQSCMSCKQNKRSGKDFVISCKTCKRGFHTGCCTIRRNSEESFAWDCAQCVEAAKKRESIEQRTQNCSSSLLLNSPSKIKSTLPVTSSTPIASTMLDNKNKQLRSLLPKTSISPVAKKFSVRKSSCSSLLIPTSSSSLLIPVTAGNKLSSSPKANSILDSKLSVNDKVSSSSTSGSEVSIDTKLNERSNSEMIDFQADCSTDKCLPSLEPYDIDDTINDEMEVEENTDGCHSDQNQLEKDKDVDENCQELRVSQDNDNWLQEEFCDVNVLASNRKNQNQNLGETKLLDAETEKCDRSSGIVNVHSNFIAWINCELKSFFDDASLVEMYCLPKQIESWNEYHVHSFLTKLGFARTANLLLENQVDGVALLLMQREDILERFSLRMGPALKLFAFISRMRDSLEFVSNGVPPNTRPNSSSAEVEPMS